MFIATRSGILTSKVSGISIVGYSSHVSSTSSRSINYPAGTQAGDLIIYVIHDLGTTATTPTGFTTVFTTAGDVNGYVKKVTYKVAGVETSFTANADGVTGFDMSLISLRGVTSVSSTYGWQYASAGGNQNISAAVTGTAILIASDRGNTTSQFSNMTAGDAYYTSNDSLYFSHAATIYLSYTSGDVKVFSDYSDTSGTSGLLLVAQ